MTLTRKANCMTKLMKLTLLHSVAFYSKLSPSIFPNAKRHKKLNVLKSIKCENNII